jgi:hypothetical protein
MPAVRFRNSDHGIAAEEGRTAVVDDPLHGGGREAAVAAQVLIFRGPVYPRAVHQLPLR